MCFTSRRAVAFLQHSIVTNLLITWYAVCSDKPDLTTKFRQDTTFLKVMEDRLGGSIALHILSLPTN